MATVLGKNSTLLEVATVVSEVLTRHDIPAVLSGGGAASLYTDTEYQTTDLDFVTTAMRQQLTPAMAEIGFVQDMDAHDQYIGRHFMREGVPWTIEFPSAPVELGNTYVPFEETGFVTTALGVLRVLSPTQCLMDRLTWYFSGTHGDSGIQAQKIIKHQQSKIDWDAIDRWAEKEGVSQAELAEFKSLIAIKS